MLQKKTIETFEQARDFAFKKLLLRDRSREEMLIDLTKRNCPGNIAQAVLNYLVKNNYLNDERLCRNMCEAWQRNGTESVRALKVKLLKRGMDKHIINAVLDTIEFDEVERAQKTLAIFLKTHKISDQRSFERLLRHMAGKGFVYPTIQKALSGFAEVSGDRNIPDLDTYFKTLYN